MQIASRAWLAIPHFEAHLHNELTSFAKAKGFENCSLRTYGSFLCFDNIEDIEKNLIA